MDPLTAFSLACGVIQVVDFSTKVVGKCRELYKYGALCENEEIESITRQLTDLATDLKLPDTAQSPGSTLQLYHDDQELLKLAQQCSGTAMELINVLQKLSVRGQHRKRETFRKAIKVIWKHDAIDNIQRSLERYRKVLDTRILINLRKQVHLVASENSNGFQDLDRKLQKVITGVAKGSNTFDELKDLVKSENSASKQHTSQEFQKHREMIAAEESHKRLLESLYFPDMFVRQEGIEEAHKQTFEWVFESPGNKDQPWHSFVDWLENGNGTYWVSGKAGSGKSTLMNFICHDPRTETALRKWSGTNDIFMPAFFFWNPGTQLQKSLAGLLRSLIYQIMERFPNSMSVLARSISPSQHGLHQLPTWTEQRLRAMLQDLLSNVSEKYHLCIFIDGLDEFEGDQAIVLSLVRKLERFTNIKFCLSSRPYRLFQDELGSSAMLKLQDLTEPDLRKFVSEELEQASPKASHVPYWSLELNHMVNRIMQKAEGVFLWVKLAVRDQIEGISEKDDAEQLERRLEALPNEIEGLYAHMLQKIHKVHRKEVAQYLQLVLHVGSPSLFRVALALHKRIDDVMLFSSDIRICDIRLHCKLIGERVTTTSRGLLEVREDRKSRRWVKEGKKTNSSEALAMQKIRPEQDEDLTEVDHYYYDTHVKFLHRTAFDFFKDNEQGKRFLEANMLAADPHPRLLYLKARIAQMAMFSIYCSVTARSVSKIMREACRVEEDTGVAQPALMDLVNRSMTMVYEKGQHQSLRVRRWWSSYISRDEGDIVTGPTDFVGFAAWFGLNRYVEHILDLDSQAGQRKSNLADHVLYCAVAGLRLRLEDMVRGRLPQKLELILAMLSRGADPNTEGPDCTAWSLYLTQCFRIHDSIHGRKFLNSISVQLRSTALAFLASGASVDERACCNIKNRFSKVAQHKFTPFDAYTVSLHLSARSILELCFAKNPNFSDFQDAFTASGASLHLECTGIFIGTWLEFDQYLRIDSKLSKQLSMQRLHQFMNTVEELLKKKHGEKEEFCSMLDRQVEDLLEGPDMEEFVQEAQQKESLRSSSILPYG